MLLFAFRLLKVSSTTSCQKRVKSTVYTPNHGFAYLFKGNSNSSLRANYCASLLNEDVKNVTKRLQSLYLKLNILKKKNILNFFHVKVKTQRCLVLKQFISPSHQSYLHHSTLKLSHKYEGKQVVFSAKNRNSNESAFLLNQLHGKDTKIINIKNDEDITIIDELHGALCFDNDTLQFILLPCHECVSSIKDVDLLIKSLSQVEKMMPSNMSTRGMTNRVIFETKNCNYLNIGLGTCRGKKGLYKRTVPKLQEKWMKRINKSFLSTKFLCEKYIPKSVLLTLNKCMQDIDMPSFSQIKTYKYVEENTGIGILDREKNNNGKMHSFIPSTSFGRDTLLRLHYDKDMFLSVVCLHCKDDLTKDNHYKTKSKIVKYFTFDNGLSVALRSGDILIFNPITQHCISSKTDEYTDKEVYCLSHYFKSLLAGRNDNSIEF